MTVDQERPASEDRRNSRDFPANPHEKRHVPKWSDVSDYLTLRSPQFDFTSSRLNACADLWDLRKLARRRTPRAVFDYVDGSAAGEVTLSRQREIYQRVEFRPEVLVDVSDLDLQTTVLGVPSELPFVFAPTGFTRLMHYQGEVAVARVAARHGIQYAISTLGTTSPEELARSVPFGHKMFQLYIWRDRSFSKELLERVKNAGYNTLILTVDTPIPGQRLRDVRNGFAIPPRLTAKTLADMSMHPAWWLNLLTTPPLEFASLSSTGGTVANLVSKVFDPQLSMADVEWLRNSWSGPIIIKGIQSVEDAMRVAKEGVEGILLSNHGGRQLDRAPVPLELLPKVLDSLGDAAEVYIDGGVMSGGDILAGLCLGARAVFVGRAYLYGLMAGGEAGVERATQLLTEEIRTQMILLGVSKVSELNPTRVHIRPN